MSGRAVEPSLEARTRASIRSKVSDYVRALVEGRPYAGQAGRVEPPGKEQRP